MNWDVIRISQLRSMLIACFFFCFSSADEEQIRTNSFINSKNIQVNYISVERGILCRSVLQKLNNGNLARVDTRIGIGGTQFLEVGFSFLGLHKPSLKTAKVFGHDEIEIFIEDDVVNNSFKIIAMLKPNGKIYDNNVVLSLDFVDGVPKVDKPGDWNFDYIQDCLSQSPFFLDEAFLQDMALAFEKGSYTTDDFKRRLSILEEMNSEYDYISNENLESLRRKMNLGNEK